MTSTTETSQANPHLELEEDALSLMEAAQILRRAMGPAFGPWRDQLEAAAVTCENQAAHLRARARHLG